MSGDTHSNAAVLFVDVVGFTTNSNDLLPSEVTSLLANIFKSFDDICKTHGVTKVKTIGDAYLAVAFEKSADERTSESANRMAQAALEMIGASFTWPSGTSVQFRIGLHIGDVVAGVIGSERLQYDVWGDTVNVASRMESTGEPGRIHVSEFFADALRDWKGLEGTGRDWKVVERGMVEVKGKGQMQTYWLSTDERE